MPVNTIGRLCGLNASLPKPTRLPIIYAPTSPATAALMCTTVPPAKSSAPCVASRPPPQDHMRNRHVGERHPHHHENQHGGETDTFSQRPDDQPDGDAGERALEGDVDILIEGAHQRFQFNIFQHHPVKAAEEAAAGAEGQGIAINDPQYADQAKSDITCVSMERTFLPRIRPP